LGENPLDYDMMAWSDLRDSQWPSFICQKMKTLDNIASQDLLDLVTPNCVICTLAVLEIISMIHRSTSPTACPVILYCP